MSNLRIWLLGLVGVVILGGVAPGAQAASDEEAPTLLGTSGRGRDGYIPALVDATGRPPAFQGLFWRLDQEWPNSWSTRDLDNLAGYGAVPFVEITTRQFDEFARSGHPSLDEMVSVVAEWAGRDPEHRLLVAPFPEANLPEHPWGSDRHGFIDSYKRVVDAFRSAGLGPDKVRFVLALNGGVREPLTYADYYPGDEYVDIVGFSKLNRNNPWRSYEESFGLHIREIQEELTLTKPILAWQTGSVEESGDRDQWLRDMFQNLAAEEQVIGAIYFNVEKTEGGKDNDYRIIADGAVNPVVRAEYPRWSPPGEAAWIFDGRMDAWEANRADTQPPDHGFVDLGSTPFENEIAWLAERGITKGCNPPKDDRFCPEAFVSRGQMAAFLVRALDLTESGDVEFEDDDASVFEADIERLAFAGITKGCNPPINDRFCPADQVTRGQMAGFLVRALGLEEGTSKFVDTSDSVFEGDIERLASAGITKGCNPPADDRFCPNDHVTRGQMAAFLNRALSGG